MKRLASFFGIAATLAGCAAVDLKPGADKVVVSRNPAPESCKFVGLIVGKQGGALAGPWTSNSNLAEGAMNDLRNKALDLRANYVELLTNQAGFTDSGTLYQSSPAQTDVTNTGNAYSCPPGDIGL